MASSVVVLVAGYRIAGWDWSDGICMVESSIFTVGYGEIRAEGGLVRGLSIGDFWEILENPGEG